MVNRYWEYPSPLPPMRQTTASGAATGLTLVDASLIGLPSKVGQYIQLVDGGAKEQAREITDHILATGELTVDRPFTDDAGAIQQILLGTRFYITPFPGVIRVVNNIYNLALAELTLMETGGTVTAPDVVGTEVAVWENATPPGVFKPLVVKINLDNMVAGDITIIREYYRTAAGGAYAQGDWVSYTGADGGLPNGNVLVTITLDPNRHGVRVTLAMTAGVVRSYAWYAAYEA